MTTRRRLDPVHPVSILPARGPPSSRLGHEHDQNDAIQARLAWHDDFNTFLKNKEEHAKFHEVKKIMETGAKARMGFLYWIAVMLVLSPLIYAVELAIFKKLFGG
jgi:hypothetical protein